MEDGGPPLRERTPNGNQRDLVPTGSWQFAGPVVMVQDELEVSSAETFTWAASETGRVVSVGRTTGGWGIIPSVFECPSGLLDFRLGVNHRATPITRTLTEGVGWPHDVIVPLGPVLCSRPDPVRELGLEILRLLHAGAPCEKLPAAFARLSHGDAAAFVKAVEPIAKRARGFDPAAIAKRFADDLQGTVAMERALVDGDVELPDLTGAARRLAGGAARSARRRFRPRRGREKEVLGAPRQDEPRRLGPQAIRTMTDDPGEVRVAPRTAGSASARPAPRSIETRSRSCRWCWSGGTPRREPEVRRPLRLGDSDRGRPFPGVRSC